MNTMLLVLSAALALAAARPQRPEEIPIIKSEYNLNPDGSYQWNYETGNGIKAQETGSLEPADDPKDGNVVVAQGGFSYTGDDGTPISLSYRADKGGFQPEGAHLPTPPPVPEAIARALAYLATLPSTPEPARGGR
ncbi:hypothetical protein R5R35_008918 [Gryllus longicercus]|uniref:Cuticular protein n=1 Tax=Gryllus longicercus TaxID=2509291 RepID=A0AAN9Z981_9ORTH